MRNEVTATVSFGLVSFQAGIGGAVTGTNEVEFKTLHACGNPTEVKKPDPKSSKNAPPKNGSVVVPIKKMTFCPACNVEATETVKGIEVAPGQFITFDDEEIDSTKPPDTKEIKLTKFVPRNEVTPIMVDKHYFLIPVKHSLDPYGLLYQTLATTKTAGIGSHWLWQRKEHPCAIYADQSYPGGVLVLQTLRVIHDLVEPDFEAPIPTDAEMKKVAKEYIIARSGSLERSDLVSAQRERLDALVAAKVSSTELPNFERPVVAPAVDLMQALRDSLAAIEKGKKS